MKYFAVTILIFIFASCSYEICSFGATNDKDKNLLRFPEIPGIFTVAPVNSGFSGFIPCPEISQVASETPDKNSFRLHTPVQQIVKEVFEIADNSPDRGENLRTGNSSESKTRKQHRRTDLKKVSPPDGFFGSHQRKRDLRHRRQVFLNTVIVQNR